MRIITSDNVAGFIRDGALVVEPGWTLAPSALEHVRRNGIRLERSEEHTSELPVTATSRMPSSA